jgi:UDP-2,3-diacylglucosamine hydrolase
MHDPTVDRFASWRAPAHWQAVDCISDLHLHSADQATFAGFRRYLQMARDQRADALFILGDLFEVWVGDDALKPQADDAQQPERGFLRACIALLHAHSRHTPTFLMVGNRDFLLGPVALVAAGMTGLDDPTVLDFLGQRWLLSHGDALCLEDTDYQRFRREVHSPAWQQAFLARPLAEREALATDMRARSEARKQALGNDPALWADVDTGAVRQALQQAGALTLIHGHTHRPARHALGPSERGQAMQRIVLSDWDLRSTQPRAEVLRLDAQGLKRMPLGAMCPG